MCLCVLSVGEGVFNTAHGYSMFSYMCSDVDFPLFFGVYNTFKYEGMNWLLQESADCFDLSTVFVVTTYLNAQTEKYTLIDQ